MRHKHVYTVFVDFSAAYDNVWHSGLLYKLYKVGMSGKIIKLLKGIYENMHSCVKVKDSCSDRFQPLKGTRQGCIMSPTLFNIHLQDLPCIFREKDCDPIKVKDKVIGSLLYADDLLILSQSSTGLQKALGKLAEYCKKWQLKVNINKTKSMVFNSRQGRYRFSYENKLIEEATQMKYLGITFTPSGNFKACFKHLYNKAHKSMYLVRKHLQDVN